MNYSFLCKNILMQNHIYMKIIVSLWFIFTRALILLHMGT